LLLLGLSMHHEAIRRVISPAKIQRRWVETSFLTLRLAGFAALVFLVLPPGKAVAFLAVQLAVFGLYMGSSFAPDDLAVGFMWWNDTTAEDVGAHRAVLSTAERGSSGTARGWRESC
jgi:hypothetical protein